MNKRSYACYDRCGFEATGPGPLGHHYKNPANASHRPPGWEVKHMTKKKHKSAKAPEHTHLSVVGAKKEHKGMWQKHAAQSREKLEVLREKIEGDIAAALIELSQARERIDYLTGIVSSLDDALGKAA